MPLGFHKAALFGVAGVSTGAVVLLHDQDYSGVTSASITSGIDSTYGEYIFGLYNINPATNSVVFHWQGSIDGGSNYNVAITSSAFAAHHTEADATGLTYMPYQDLAQGTAFQPIASDQGNGSDENLSGVIHLFNPASTTYVKNFTQETNCNDNSDYASHDFKGGYFNTTSAINAVQFKMSSGNFDGTIKMWGVK
jgi:hypothetical protein